VENPEKAIKLVGVPRIERDIRLKVAGHVTALWTLSRLQTENSLNSALLAISSGRP